MSHKPWHTNPVNQKRRSMPCVVQRKYIKKLQKDAVPMIRKKKRIASVILPVITEAALIADILQMTSTAN